MWSLIDIIENSKTPIHTYYTGYAMSAALKIFLAGHKRYCTRHATFMYHQMSNIRMGTYQDLVEDREQLDYLNKQSEDYILERTKFSKERYTILNKSHKFAQRLMSRCRFGAHS